MSDNYYMSADAGTIEIPLKDSDEVIELGLDQLPDGEEVLSILKQESCPLHVWIRLSIAYYKQGKINDFVHILESSKTNANINYKNHEKDKLKVKRCLIYDIHLLKKIDSIVYLVRHLTLWRPITSNKPTRRKTRSSRRNTVSRPQLCTHQPIRSSCTTLTIC